MAGEGTARLFKKLTDRFGLGLMEVVALNTSDGLREESAQGKIGPETIKLFKALTDQFGPGVLEIAEQNTSEMACFWLQEADIPQRDLSAVFTHLWDNIAKIPEFVFTVEEKSPQRVSFKVTSCPHANLMKEQDAAGIGYAFMCAYDQGFCQGLNPKIHFTRGKTLMMGDDCCDHTYELEDS